MRQVYGNCDAKVKILTIRFKDLGFPTLSNIVKRLDFVTHQNVDL